jgi:hypothetical protein
LLRRRHAARLFGQHVVIWQYYADVAATFLVCAEALYFSASTSFHRIDSSIVVMYHVEQ